LSPAPGPDLAERFFSGTGFSYDRIVTLCTLGLDRAWKRAILAKIPPDSKRVLDQGAGTGILTFAIARRCPRARVVGVELRREYLAFAAAKKQRLGVRNVEFVQGRAEDVVLRGEVDVIASSYLAKYAELGRLVANARQMLRDGGLLIAHDFTYPSPGLPLAVWKAYFRVLQTLGPRLHPEWREAFFGLPALLRSTTWVEQLVESLRSSGFEEPRVRRLAFGAAAWVTARKAAGSPG